MARDYRFELGLMRTDRGEFIDKGNVVVNPRHMDFDDGAEGDGIRDDGVAFNLARAHLPTEGGTVQVSPGDYLLTTAFTFGSQDNVVLWLMPGVVLTGSALPTPTGNNFILDWRSGVLGTHTTPVTITDTTQSTSTITGALIVSGGVGIAKNTFIGGILNVAGTGFIADGLAVGVEEFDFTIAGATVTAKLAVHAEGDSDLAGLVVERHTNTAGFGAHLLLLRSRGDESSETIVASGDTLGRVTGIGHDGTDFAQAAEIRFEVDGTPGTGDMPGRILFLVSPDGSETPAEAVRISQNKLVAFAGVVSVDDTTESTSTTTGSIHTDGGLGVVKTVNIGTILSVGGVSTRGITSHLHIFDTANAGYTLENAAGGTDAKVWDLITNGDNLQYRTVSDAYLSPTVWMQVNRSGVTIDEIFLQATTVNASGGSVKALTHFNAVSSGSDGSAYQFDGRDAMITTSSGGSLLIGSDGDNQWGGVSIGASAITTQITGLLSVLEAASFAEIVSVDDTTDTSSGVTGSIHTDGGIGIAKKLFVGTDASVGGILGVTGEATFAQSVRSNDAGAISFLAANNATDATEKQGSYSIAHYTNAEQPFGLIRGNSAAATNTVHVGGGSATVNAATSITFYTAADNTTITGTARASINSSGVFNVVSNVTIGGTSTFTGAISVPTGTEIFLSGQGTDTYIKENGADNMQFVVGAGQRLTLNIGGANIVGSAGIGVSLSSTTFGIFGTSTTAKSSARFPHGTAPTSPVNGDVWTTTAGIFVRINGSTVGPLS